MIIQLTFGNPGGSPESARRVVNKQFLHDMALAWRKHGMKALETCAKESPAAFCKLYALIVSKQMTVEHSSGVKGLTDEQLDQAIEALRAMIDQKAGDLAKVVEGEVVSEAVGLPKPE